MTPPITLEQVRRKFPNAKFAPEDGCVYCGGTGEKVYIKGKSGQHPFPPGYPCICIFSRPENQANNVH